MLLRLIAGAVFTALAFSCAYAWSPEAMNDTIEQTNFVVEKGCSGTLISLEKRLILTNYHCISEAIQLQTEDVLDDDGTVEKKKKRKLEEVVVEQSRYDGFRTVGTVSYVSEIAAFDKKRDLAVLRVLTPLPNSVAASFIMDGKQVMRGETVYAVGNPTGYEATVTQGIVSSVHRYPNFSWVGQKMPSIQFSAGIWFGNSGGALYNNDGELIGVPVAVGESSHFGFAVPVNEVVKPFLKENCLMFAENEQRCNKGD